MNITKLVGERTKETPADAVVKSHILLTRAGYIKQVGSGIYTLNHLCKRVAAHVERVIREEMASAGAQEVSFPVVMPRDIWDETGRYSSIGAEMARFTDRAGHGMLLGMTHEEAAVHFARHNLSSYQQLPVCIYQIQTKFRDEPRCRAGLIRVREFVMKDAYSFHMTAADLEAYYAVMLAAYDRIFRRLGFKNFLSVKSDTGMMGGSAAHEFMALSDIGEDTLVLCPSCGYRANIEVAESKTRAANSAERVRAGEACKDCGKPLTFQNGIEIGNIFQLGTKYTASMNMTVLDEKGAAVHPLMGCYGIGVGRAVAALAEEYADERGLVWPAEVAPYKAHITALSPHSGNVGKLAAKLYHKLNAAGVDTILDDRDVSAGIKFADADLLGMPVRIVLSPKSLAGKEAEITARRTGQKQMVPYAAAVKAVKELLKSL